MRKNSFGQGIIAFLVVIGIFAFIGVIEDASEPKCIKSGCDNKQASGSSYCYLHKPYSSNSSSYGGSTYSSESSGSTTGNYNSGKSSINNNSYYSSETNKSSTEKGSSEKSTYDSYDDGYDDIYMDGDYDYDRYDKDSDYADGVDDAMDEFEEDW